MSFIRKVFVLICTFSLLSIALAADKRHTDLRVSGLVTAVNSKDGKAHEFTLKDLEKLSNVSIKATTRFTGSATFTGPLIRDILKMSGISNSATEVVAKGIDGYTVTIPIAELNKYDVVAASSINGKKLDIESKGPLWIMYPVDKFPNELAGDATATRMVWNLVELKVQ